MKQKYIVLLLFCGLLCCPQFVWAKVKKQPLDIPCFDIEYCCEQYTQNDDVYHFTYEDGTFNIQQNEKYHFLILDGQYVQVPIKIIKDKAFVPLSALTNSMDCTIEQKGNTLFLMRKGQKLPISSKDRQIDENKMLGLRDVMEALGNRNIHKKRRYAFAKSIDCCGFSGKQLHKRTSGTKNTNSFAFLYEDGKRGWKDCTV